jgi:hypothetical protein
MQVAVGVVHVSSLMSRMSCNAFDSTRMSPAHPSGRLTTAAASGIGNHSPVFLASILIRHYVGTQAVLPHESTTAHVIDPKLFCTAN